MAFNSLPPPGILPISQPGTPTQERDSSALEFTPFHPDSTIAKLGRTLSSISMTGAMSAEPDEMVSKPSPSSPLALTSSVTKEPETGSETETATETSGTAPVLCPFCQKPLPSSLLAAQSGHDHSDLADGRKSLLAALPVDPPAAPAAVPLATSESFMGDVQSGDKANISAASELVTPEDLKRWSEFAGMSIPVSKSTPSAIASSSKPPPPKAIPLIPPPPPPAGNKLTKPAPNHTDTNSNTANKFSFGFRRGSRPDPEDEESEDDDMAGKSGYAKLLSPGSPGMEEDSEDDGQGYGGISVKRGKKAGNIRDSIAAAGEGKSLNPENQVNADDRTGQADPQTVKSKSEILAQPEVKMTDTDQPEKSTSDREVRKVLQEVVGRVNQLSTSHADLLNSHSTLLTSLKIARSNLAMAEANAEMLEDELRRTKVAATSRVVSAQNPARTPVTPAPGLNRVASGVGHNPRLSHDQPRTNPSGVSVTRASTGDKARPNSIQIPNSNNLQPSPSSAGPSAGSSLNSAEPSKSVFGFWKGGKQKLPGGFGTVTIPSPAQVMAAIPSRPGTPTGEGSRFDIGSWAPPDPSTVGKSVKSPPFRNIDPPGLMRSASYSTLPSSPSSSTPGAGGTARQTSQLRDDGSGSITAKSPPNSNLSASSSSELFKLRQAYSSAIAKMSNMSTELENLKKGKIEMEAELEGLSQALFEEANKMVADERKKRLEVEEGLKDVIQEREALKKVVEVLGGKADEVSIEGVKNDAETSKQTEKKKVTGLEDSGEAFQPRALDKHYQALRETIHHVGDGSPTKRQAASSSQPQSPSPSTANQRNWNTSSTISAPNAAEMNSSTKAIPSSPKIPPILAPSANIASPPSPIETISPAPPPTEPNPWASTAAPETPVVTASSGPSSLLPPVDLISPSSTADTAGEGQPILSAANLGSDALEKIQSKKDGGLASPAVQDLDRLMERLQADMNGDM